MSKSLRTQVLIVGGGTGGVAAAIALGNRGISCIMTEPTDWVGGQLTSQAVPPDENRWIEGKEGVQSATSLYLEYRSQVRAWYRKNRPLTPAAHNNAYLNPGDGWVSHLCHEPRVGHAVLVEMLSPYVKKGLLTVFLKTSPVIAATSGDRITSVTFEKTTTGERTTIEADYVLDASELGDVLKLGNVEYNAGAEHKDVHGELHGRPDKTDVHDIQSISWCFALEHKPGEDHTIEKPASYSFWRDFVPPLTPDKWPGKLLSWTVLGGSNHVATEFRWKPWPEGPNPNEWEMWRYRRIVDTTAYTDATNHPDVALINMVQMDYFLKPTLEVSDEQLQTAFNEAKELSRCFLYWMQTEAPRFNGTQGTGYPGLKLRGDELGTTDGFAKYPYIRESRRLDALTIVSEKHVGMEQRRAEGLVPPDAPPQGIGELFHDSVGIGHYRLDLHPSTAMRSSIYVEAAPFRIPLGALIPKRVKNVIAAGKCLGVTHITNGCFRLHPVEWNVGESAGHLAGYCLANNTTPHRVHSDLAQTRQLQRELTASGIPLSWPWEKGANL